MALGSAPPEPPRTGPGEPADGADGVGTVVDRGDGLRLLDRVGSVVDGGAGLRPVGRVATGEPLGTGVGDAALTITLPAILSPVIVDR